MNYIPILNNLFCKRLTACNYFTYSHHLQILFPQFINIFHKIRNAQRAFPHHALNSKLPSTFQCKFTIHFKSKIHLHLFNSFPWCHNATTFPDISSIPTLSQQLLSFRNSSPSHYLMSAKKEIGTLFYKLVFGGGFTHNIYLGKKAGGIIYSDPPNPTAHPSHYL